MKVFVRAAASISSCYSFCISEGKVPVLGSEMVKSIIEETKGIHADVVVVVQAKWHNNTPMTCTYRYTITHTHSRVGTIARRTPSTVSVCD